MPRLRGAPYTIYVKKGMYVEKLVLPAWKTNIHIKGENADSTILMYHDYTGKIDSATGIRSGRLPRTPVWFPAIIIRLKI